MTIINVRYLYEIHLLDILRIMFGKISVIKLMI